MNHSIDASKEIQLSCIPDSLPITSQPDRFQVLGKTGMANSSGCWKTNRELINETGPALYEMEHSGSSPGGDQRPHRPDLLDREIPHEATKTDGSQFEIYAGFTELIGDKSVSAVIKEVSEDLSRQAMCKNMINCQTSRRNYIRKFYQDWYTLKGEFVEI